jgi:hypothetical protein
MNLQTNSSDALDPLDLKRRDEERKAALDRMAKEAFEGGLYDRAEMPEDAEDD